jgi:hypothetical protein
MSFNVKKITKEVYNLLNCGKYEFVGTDNVVEDYIDGGLNYSTTAQDIINGMIDEGDVVEIQHA